MSVKSSIKFENWCYYTPIHKNYQIQTTADLAWPDYTTVNS